jgi:hypothetical protein
MAPFLLSIFFILNTFSPPIIAADAAIKHIGETVKIVDKVYSSTVEPKQRILKIGGSSEHQYLRVLIKLGAKSNLDQQEKTRYTGYNIYVTGKLIYYKGSPAIIVNDPKQLGIVMVDHDLHPAFN